MSLHIPVEVQALVSGADGAILVFLDTEHDAKFVRVYLNGNPIAHAPGIATTLEPS